MIKFLILLLLCFSTNAFATDIHCGKANVTNDQITHIAEINLGFIDGITVQEDGNVTATTNLPNLTPAQRALVISEVEALPNTNKGQLKKAALMAKLNIIKGNQGWNDEDVEALRIG